MRILITVAVAACLSGCMEKVEPTRGGIAPGTNVDVPAIEWRIRSREQLDAIYRASGKDPGEKNEAGGFIGKDHRTGRVVIYTLPPRTVDDSVTADLGHEFMHAALGDYHRAREAK